MSSQNSYGDYLLNEETLDREYHNSLANFLERLLSKKPNNSFGLLDEEIAKKVYQPSDLRKIAENKKELVYRMLYTFISKNKLYDAAHCLIYMIRSFNVNYCIIWRAGFHIIQSIGSREDLDNFVNGILEVHVVDQSNMIYEYMLYLMKMNDFEAVTLLYNENSIQKRLYSRSNRITDTERNLVPLLIKLTVANSYYCMWKKSLFSKDSIAANKAATESEMYFTEMIALMDQGQPVDNYIENYVDVLLWGGKHIETLRILRLYYDKCPRCVNSSRYLLKFLIEYKDNLPQISNKEISDLRVDYIWKMMPINTNDDEFTLEMLRDCADQLEKASELESLTSMLFELLEHSSWSSVEWPWQRLLSCVQIMGVENDLVKDKWTIREMYWPDMYQYCEHAQSLLKHLQDPRIYPISISRD